MDTSDSDFYRSRIAALEVYCRELRAERDTFRQQVDHLKASLLKLENDNGLLERLLFSLRAELATCNQAVVAAQARISALEKVAEAARTIFATTPAVGQYEMVRLIDALAALDIEPHVCKCGKRKGDDANG